MKIAAAKAIASLVGARELNEEYIIPSVFDARVVVAVAAAVAKATYEMGAARRTRKSVGLYRLV
jgi:malate dehydrogenase (oxaloacetate-decarboxylating)